MKTLIIFNHPNLTSYCGAIKQSVISGLKETGHAVDVIDLDRDRFNPVMSTEDLVNWRKGIATDPQILTYQERIKSADHLVFIFPIWWELMPALTKGFIDKVFLKNFAYTEPKPRRPFVNQLKNIQSVTLITTMTVPRFIYTLWFSNAIQRAFIRGTFKKIGIKKTKWISIASLKSVDDTKRQKWLTEIHDYFAKKH